MPESAGCTTDRNAFLSNWIGEIAPKIIGGVLWESPEECREAGTTTKSSTPA